jgi:hypothetical protein
VQRATARDLHAKAGTERSFACSLVCLLKKGWAPRSGGIEPGGRPRAVRADGLAAGWAGWRTRAKGTPQSCGRAAPGRSGPLCPARLTMNESEVSPGSTLRGAGLQRHTARVSGLACRDRSDPGPTMLAGASSSSVLLHCHVIVIPRAHRSARLRSSSRSRRSLRLRLVTNLPVARHSCQTHTKTHAWQAPSRSSTACVGVGAGWWAVHLGIGAARQLLVCLGAARRPGRCRKAAKEKKKRKEKGKKRKKERKERKKAAPRWRSPLTLLAREGRGVDLEGHVHGGVLHLRTQQQQ